MSDMCMPCVLCISSYIFYVGNVNMFVHVQLRERKKQNWSNCLQRPFITKSNVSVTTVVLVIYRRVIHVSISTYVYNIGICTFLWIYIFSYIYIYFRYNVYKIVTVMMLLESAIVNFCPFANLEADICHGVPLPISKHG